MSTEGYPFGDALVPDRFDEHTIVLLVRPNDAPGFTEEELDRLQAAEYPERVTDAQRP